MNDVELSLPHNLEAERAVLGSVLVDNSRLTELQDTLRGLHFYRKAHRHIWESLLALDHEQSPLDMVTVHEHLHQQGLLDDVGGGAYIASLIDGTPRSTNAAYYGAIVVEKALLRDLIALTSKVRSQAYAADEPATTLISELEGALLALSQRRAGEGFISAEQWMRETADTVARLTDQQQMVTGVATGFGRLDQMTRGLQPGNLVVIAGRPSMGKTALVQQIGLQAALQLAPRGAVGFFSLEMSREELGLRAAAVMAEIPAFRIMAGKLWEADYARLVAGFDKLAGTSFFLDDTPGISPEQVRSRARRLAMKHDLKLVIIDYLQLLQPTRHGENRQQEVAAMSRAMKVLSKELRVPVVVLSQLSRANEARADKRPQLSDLRESGAIEQDADLVLLIHRPDYYEATPLKPGLTEVIVAKQRNGPTGTVELRFHSTQTRFSAWDEDRSQA